MAVVPSNIVIKEARKMGYSDQSQQDSFRNLL